MTCNHYADFQAAEARRTAANNDMRAAAIATIQSVAPAGAVLEPDTSYEVDDSGGGFMDYRGVTLKLAGGSVYLPDESIDELYYANFDEETEALAESFQEADPSLDVGRAYLKAMTARLQITPQELDALTRVLSWLAREEQGATITIPPAPAPVEPPEPAEPVEQPDLHGLSNGLRSMIQPIPM